MSQRFLPLYRLKSNLYFFNSPIIVSACVLLKDNETESIILQMKFHSISEKVIKALKISIDTYDVSGKPLGDIVNYQYLDLSVKNGDYFGSNKAIVMPNAITRSIEIQNITVIFEAGDSYDISGTQLAPLPTPAKLTATLGNPELVKQYQITSNTLGEYAPQTIHDLWQCTCGEVNSTPVCTKCGAKQEVVFKTYNRDLLQKYVPYRLATEKEERRQKAALEEKARREEAQKKKKKRNLIITSIVVSISTVIALIAINIISEQKAYNAVLSEIEEYIDNERYEEAFDKIRLSDLTSEDEDKYREIVIPRMQAQHEEMRNSSNSLVFYDGHTEYHVKNDKIYSTQNGETIVLYEAPESGESLGTFKYYHLSSEWCLYANNYLFFVESHHWVDKEPYEDGYVYAAKYINLETGEVETITREDGYSEIYAIAKLEYGNIYFALDWWNEKDGVIFNPYTQKMYEGEDVVYDRELESAIYFN